MNLPTRSVVPTAEPIAELDRLGDEIAQLSAHLEAATARLLELIRDFDARGGWNSGFRSCAAWLSWRVGLDLGAARERLCASPARCRRCRVSPLRSPGVSSPTPRSVRSREWRRRRRKSACSRWAAPAPPITSSGSCVAGDEWTARRRHARLRSGIGAAPCTCGGTTTAWSSFTDGSLPRSAPCSCERWRRRATQCIGSSTPRRRRRLTARRRAWRSSRPMRSRCSPRPRSTTVSTPARRASATRSWSMLTLRCWPTPMRLASRFLEDGARVSAETSQRLACDASRVVMRHDAQGRVTEIGARTRTIPPALRRALQHRDLGCRFPGCGLPFGQGHHPRHWAHGGPTTLSNLALLCRRHHRAVHEEDYRVRRLRDGSLEFRRPDGRLLPDVPSPEAVLADAVRVLREENRARGIDAHPRTMCAEWQGESLDVGYAVTQ
jgi:HNH endonuclease